MRICEAGLRDILTYLSPKDFRLRIGGEFGAPTIKLSCIQSGHHVFHDASAVSCAQSAAWWIRHSGEGSRKWDLHLGDRAMLVRHQCCARGAHNKEHYANMVQLFLGTRYRANFLGLLVAETLTVS